MTAPFWRGLPAILLACLSLSGCIPLAARPDVDSRTNLPDGVPDFIRIGEVTRTDVMHALGQPDACAADESWIMYASAWSKGGMLLTPNGLAGVSIDRIRYARLIVRFDTAGTVTQTFNESASCWVSWTSTGRGQYMGPCIDVSGHDVPGKYQLAPMRE